MAALDSSSRTLLTATYVPLVTTSRTSSPPGRARDKAQFATSLQLQPGEAAAAFERLQNRGDQVPQSVSAALAGYERDADRLRPVPEASTLAGIDPADLIRFGRAVTDLRLAAAQSAADPPDGTGSDGTTRLRPALTRSPTMTSDLAASDDVRYLVAHNATDTFEKAVQISPIGMLNLERIEMAPAGIQRGELLATVPLAPSEQTNVVQKQWSVTSSEFTSIVTDSLDNYSEKGVTEKAELADASSNQTKHANQISLGASVSGSYGMVSFTTNASLGISDSTEQSRQASRKKASETTSKASSRVRQERKVTIETQSTVGTEDTTTRTLVNPSDKDSMRIDYFSMMRTWRVRLLQYGLRLTYDIAVPEPGATLRLAHARLAQLEAQLTTPFRFGLNLSDVTAANYAQLAADNGASVASPPQQTKQVRIGGVVDGLGNDDNWHFTELELDIDDGYEVTGVWLDAMLDNVDNDSDSNARDFIVFGYGQVPDLRVPKKGSFVVDLSGDGAFLVGRTGHQKIVYYLHNVSAAAVTFALTLSPTTAMMDQWRMSVWQTLHDAARDAYYTGLQALSAERDALQAQLTGVDTLTLRQEDRTEIMKAALRWLLGPDFDFMPPSVSGLFDKAGGQNGTAFTGNELGLDSAGWAAMFRYQEMVKFLQQAVEWENLLYFLYPYFWDVPPAWDFVRMLQHPDPDRQTLLRAGSARITLTIRPGFEQAFMAFVDQGSFGSVLPPDHPYLTIGDELAAYDRTNYPGIPPANPDTDYRPLLSTMQRRAWAGMQQIIPALESYLVDHGAYPTTAQGLAALADPSLPADDPWGRDWVYVCPGTYTEYELSSRGADGKPGGDGVNAEITSWASASLIGEWFEYTPSAGVDIQVNTSPAAMS